MPRIQGMKRYRSKVCRSDRRSTHGRAEARRLRLYQ
jgi:hypothetical protein